MKKAVLLLFICNLFVMSAQELALANKDGKYGYINTKGEWVIQPNFKFASIFAINLSIAITSQNAFDCPAPIRRMANCWVIFKQPDLISLITLASRTGLKSKHMLYIMSRLLNQPHDSLWIDLIRFSPAPYRLNG